MRFAALATALVASALLAPAGAQTIRSDAGFSAVETPRNDDAGWTFELPFSVTWDGLTTSTLAINNNGYVSFGPSAGHIRPCLGSETGGFSSTCAERAFLGFNNDLDSRHGDTSPLTYGMSMVDGRQAFGANWLNFGYYSHGSPAMDFQIVLIDRADRGTGDFDVEFNYGNMPMNGGRSGWVATASSGAMLDPNTGTPIADLSNSRYAFQVQGGVASGVTAVNLATVPEPSTYALMGTGLLGLAAAARRRRRA